MMFFFPNMSHFCDTNRSGKPRENAATPHGIYQSGREENLPAEDWILSSTKMADMGKHLNCPRFGFLVK